MKHFRSHSKTGLFLMEMIISLLIISLTACICVQIFAGAKKSRQKAREWNSIQEMTVTAGEFLEGSNGSYEEFLALYPEGDFEDRVLHYYYDSNWFSCPKEDHMYRFQLVLEPQIHKKTAHVSFYRKSELLYEQEISFPVFSTREEEPFS